MRSLCTSCPGRRIKSPSVPSTGRGNCPVAALRRLRRQLVALSCLAGNVFPLPGLRHSCATLRRFIYPSTRDFGKGNDLAGIAIVACARSSQAVFSKITASGYFRAAGSILEPAAAIAATILRALSHGLFQFARRRAFSKILDVEDFQPPGSKHGSRRSAR